MARGCFEWMPGRSANTICRPGRVSTPWMRVRVVWGRGLTMLTLRPSSVFRMVDLPTFGRPTSAAMPQRDSPPGPVASTSCCGSVMRLRLLVQSGEHALRGSLLRAAPARAFAAFVQAERRDLAARHEPLVVRVAAHLLHRIGRQAQAAGLQQLLQPRLRVLQLAG